MVVGPRSLRPPTHTLTARRAALHRTLTGPAPTRPRRHRRRRRPPPLAPHPDGEGPPPPPPAPARRGVARPPVPRSDPGLSTHRAPAPSRALGAGAAPPALLRLAVRPPRAMHRARPDPGGPPPRGGTPRPVAHGTRQGLTDARPGPAPGLRRTLWASPAHRDTRQRRLPCAGAGGAGTGWTPRPGGPRRSPTVSRKITGREQGNAPGVSANRGHGENTRGLAGNSVGSLARERPRNDPGGAPALRAHWTSGLRLPPRWHGPRAPEDPRTRPASVFPC